MWPEGLVKYCEQEGITPLFHEKWVACKAALDFYIATSKDNGLVYVFDDYELVNVFLSLEEFNSVVGKYEKFFTRVAYEE